MKKIKLTQGYFAEVDDGDYEALQQYRWHAKRRANGTVYAATNIPKDGGGYQWTMMHRFLLDPPQGMVTDHIDVRRAK